MNSTQPSQPPLGEAHFGTVNLSELSGERLTVCYRIKGTQSQAYTKANDICLEQTVEIPEEILPPGAIKDSIIGKVESFRQIDESLYDAVISYAIECTSFEVAQTLNILFGNISIKPGIRLQKVEFPSLFFDHFRGPRFGRAGLRTLLGVPERPLLCAALKPLGLSPVSIAELAFKFASGGIDIIKDSHGVTNQSFCSFKDRVRLCCEAIKKANEITGEKTIYAPNVTGPNVWERAHYAKECGAGAILVAPALVGYETLRALADDDSLNLPIISHPSFQGSYITSYDSGMAHGVLFGQMARLIGADVTIFPNSSGRFSFSPEDCSSIVQGTHNPMGHLAPIFPCAAGGMTLDRIPEMMKTFGKDTIYLVTSGLYKCGPDLLENCKTFREQIKQ